MGQGDDKENTEMVKRKIYILDSINKKELECKIPISDDRKLKIAKGSGCHLNEVNRLIEDFKNTKKLIEKFLKMNISDNPKDLERNPK